MNAPDPAHRGAKAPAPRTPCAPEPAGPSPLTFRVVGLPAPQGSKRHVGNGRLVESSKQVGPWRESVVAAAMAQLAVEERGLALGAGIPFGTGVAVHVDATFWLHPPLTAQRAHARGRSPVPSVRPDLDKLARALLDALTGIVLWDDGQVAALTVAKRWALDDRMPGVDVTVRAARGDS